MTNFDIDEKFMTLALQESRKSQEMNEVPVGAIVVMNDKVISQAHNQPISQNDPTSHAEVNAIRKASQNLGNYRLTDATLYVMPEVLSYAYPSKIPAYISVGCEIISVTSHKAFLAKWVDL